MIFPWIKFWKYTPLGWAAVIIWNCCELFDIPAPYPHILFGYIMGVKGVRTK